MPAPLNPLKRRLDAGEVTHGIWLGLADAYCAEIAATAGFDWLLIDGEHAPNDIRSLSARQGEGWVASLPLGRSVAGRLRPNFVFLRDGQMVRQLARPGHAELEAAFRELVGGAG